MIDERSYHAVVSMGNKLFIVIALIKVLVHLIVTKSIVIHGMK